MLRRFRAECRLWFSALTRAIPGEIGCAVRRRFSGLSHCGIGTRILEGVRFYHPRHIRIGRDCIIAANCQLNGGGGIAIGDCSLIGPGCLLWSQNHNYSELDIPVHAQGYTKLPIIIEYDCWLGAGCVVLPGVTLGRGTVVAAGAVVTKSTAPFSVVAGIPARVISQRGTDENRYPRAM